MLFQMMHFLMENSSKTSVQLNLNLKMHNSESTLFGLRRVGLLARELLPVFFMCSLLFKQFSYHLLPKGYG